MLGLQGLQLPQQPVVFKIRHSRRIQLIIKPVGLLQQLRQPLHFLLDVHLSFLPFLPALRCHCEERSDVAIRFTTEKHHPYELFIPK